eukprot:m.111198 g.111198  ORF g.111198 m.111198 type:complete len:278 (-) comp12918_c0_seq1:961-1794(-)
MGGGGSKPLMFGTVKITGEKLHEEGVVIAEPGQVDLGRSAELHFKITSTERGSFSILAKYLGTVIKEIEFTHEELISLVQDSEASTEYQALAKKLDYSRKGSKLIMARAFSLDVTKLLPYLYERFGKQDLADTAEALVKEKQLTRLRAMSDASKKGVKSSGSQESDPTIDEHVKELEAIEKQLSSTSSSSSLKSAAKKSQLRSTSSSSSVKSAATMNQLRSNSSSSSLKSPTTKPRSDSGVSVGSPPKKKDRWATADNSKRSPVKTPTSNKVKSTSH